MRLLFLLIMSFVFVFESRAGPQSVFKSKEGIYEIKLSWDHNELGDDVLSAKLKFKGNEIDCEDFGFVQAARVLDNKSKIYLWPKISGQEARNEVRTEGGWFVDHNSSNCKKGNTCSPFYVDHWGEGGQNGTKEKYATMEDYPFGWTNFSEIKLESCLVCRKSNTVYSCVSYGGKWGLTSDKELIIPKISSPSREFKESFSLFKEYYRKNTTD